MDELKKLLGLRIKEFRQKRNLSQEQLAEMIGLDRRSVSNIECGNTFPSSSLAKIAQVLEVSVKSLFDFETSSKSIEVLIDEIIAKLYLLSPEDVKLIHRLVEYM